MATRTRLSPEERREQLLTHGAHLFATQPYEDVHIERVAELAGVSRGLLYHYFPTKRAFFAALLERAAGRLADATAPDPDQSPRQQLVAGVERYLAHCAANPAGMRAIHRGAASADPDVVAIVTASSQLHEERVLEVLEPTRTPDPVLVIAVRSWIALLRAWAYEWREAVDAGAEVVVDDVRDACVGALVGTLAALPPHACPERLDALTEQPAR